jgi:hypothetical protein
MQVIDIVGVYKPFDIRGIEKIAIFKLFPVKILQKTLRRIITLAIINYVITEIKHQMS